MLSTKISIISSIDSPRLDYTLDFIFNHFFDCGYEIVKEVEAGSVSIGYGINNIGLAIPASTYLSGKALLPEPEVINTRSGSFDLFAFVFYFLSRAEEYGFQSKETFGRFSSTDAQFKEELSTPLVDIYLLKLAIQLKAKYNIELKRSTGFKLIHTVDVDQFYAFKSKSLKRTLGGLGSAMLNANVKELKDRIKSLIGGGDPYDSFEFLQRNSELGEAHYFMLVGNYDRLDNALDISKGPIKSQLLDLSKTASIGLHPSIRSNDSKALLQEEKQKLEAVMSGEIRESRQHFLKLRFPDTYQALSEVGIKVDHTLGYHDAIGFRAGTSNPFYWFDLDKNKVTDLLIQPLLVMDVTLMKYLNLEPAAAIAMVKNIIDQCKEVEAPFSLLWHNSSFYEQEGWAGWREVYLAIINYCQELSA